RRHDVDRPGLRGHGLSRVCDRRARPAHHQREGGGMSSRPQVAVLPPLGRRATRPGAIATAAPDRVGTLVVAFAAFSFYGALRWATMLPPEPIWRSLGMVVVATAIVAIGMLLDGRARWLVVCAGIVALLAMFAFSGVPFSWVRHLRIWATADG